MRCSGGGRGEGGGAVCRWAAVRSLASGERLASLGLAVPSGLGDLHLVMIWEVFPGLKARPSVILIC